MWRNYLVVAVRALAKSRTYAFINIFGLALGLAACLLILLYVRYELSYDEWLPNAENIYQLQTFYEDPKSGIQSKLTMASMAAGEALKKDFPQVDRIVHATSGSFTVLRGGEAIAVEKGALVNGPFFDIFQFPLVEGDPATALRNLGSLALSQSQARRLFGNAPAVGQTLTLMMRGKAVDHRVTAIFKDLPRNSHMRFNMLARYDPGSYFADQPEMLSLWDWQTGWYYVVLKPGTDPDAIQAAMPAWEERNMPDATFSGRRYDVNDQQDYQLVNVRDVHLGEAQDGAASPGNDRRTILTFGIVALLILAMACVNFTNLATARASKRAREIALRKVLGASRRQLILQFLGESVLVAALAMLVALAIVEVLLPAFASFLDADLSFTYFGAGGLLLPILALIVLVGAAGGIYPAFYLSRFQPAQVLKANKSMAEASGSGRLRNILVIGQFAVSIGLIICTWVVYAQTVHARTSDPGYRRDGLLQVEGLARRQLEPITETLVREIERLDGVVSAGRTSIGIATPNSTTSAVAIPGADAPVSLESYVVDQGFFDTMGIRLLAGRAFDESRPMDDATLPFPDEAGAIKAQIARGGINIVVNAFAARRLGFRDPADAVGRQVKVALTAERYGLTPATIIGVLEDSRFRSIRAPIEPIMFRMTDAGFSEIVIRYDSPHPERLRSAVENVWKRVVTDAPFRARFSDEIVATLYRSETARAQIFAGFAMLAIVIACLGLFGLAAFTAERRTKEIGIRKVLGARTADIVRLLAWQFSRPVIIANLIAWPVAWWAMRNWLNRFDDRIVLGPTPFLAAAALALAIALGTIAGHAFKVARANPIHALRYE